MSEYLDAFVAAMNQIERRRETAHEILTIASRVNDRMAVGDLPDTPEARQVVATFIDAAHRLQDNAGKAHHTLIGDQS